MVGEMTPEGIAGWITAISMAGLLIYQRISSVALSVRKQKRQDELNARQDELNAHQQDRDADEKNIRERFQFHLNLLEERINCMTEEMDRSQKAHVECEKERAKSDARLGVAEERIKGLEREIAKFRKTLPTGDT